MTLAELSKKIGVSTATISRVLNDDGSVSAATKEKILHDLEAYGYQKRPRRKSSLVQNSDTALALIGKLTNPIAVAFLNGISPLLITMACRSWTLCNMPIGMAIAAFFS